MKYSQIKLDLISAGIPQREVLEACKSSGVHVNMALRFLEHHLELGGPRPARDHLGHPWISM